MYYPCSENKGAEQLRGYREADLRLCFRRWRLLVFSRAAYIKNQPKPIKAIIHISGQNGLKQASHAYDYDD